MTVAELNEFVRFTLGSLSQSVIDDVTLDKVIQNVLDAGLATTDCQEKFYSVKQTLIYLDTETAAGSAGTGASGAVKKRVEEVGKRRVEIQWETSGDSGSAASWAKVLEDFLADPQSYLLCNPFPSTGSGSGGSVLIGNSGKGKYENAAPWRKSLVTPTPKTWDEALYPYRNK